MCSRGIFWGGKSSIVLPIAVWIEEGGDWEEVRVWASFLGRKPKTREEDGGGTGRGVPLGVPLGVEVGVSIE